MIGQAEAEPKPWIGPPRRDAIWERSKGGTLPPMLIEGLGLMTVGMSTVFAFLGILVISIHALARVAVYFLPEEPTDPDAPQTETEDAEIAVVLAAIEVYRRGSAAARGSG